MEMLPHNYLLASERRPNAKADSYQPSQETEIPSDSGWHLKSGSVLNDRNSNHSGYTIFQESFRQSRGILEDDDDASSLDNTQNSEIKALQGARSLKAVAIRHIVKNLDDYDLTAQTLQSPMSLNLWKLFSKHLRCNDNSNLNLLRYRQQIRQCRSPLDVYTIPLTSKTFDFITYLSLTTVHSSVDLIRLSDMTNLGVLEIYNNYVRSDFHTTDQSYTRGKSSLDIVDDRLVKAWSMAATEIGAFPVLRILKLWYHRSVTERSLAFISSFPSLAVYDIYGCGFRLGAAINKRLSGWRPTVDSHILSLLEAACVERVQIMQNSKGSGSQLAGKILSTQLNDYAPTRKMRRADITGFLIRLEKLDPESLIHASLTDMDEPDCRSSRISQTWEFVNYTAFARIGELRNDKDLRRAGIEIGDQILVGEELINSIPIVSLRVGPTPSLLKYNPIRDRATSIYTSAFSEETAIRKELSKEKENPSAHLAFVRIKLPPLEASVNIPLKRSSDGLGDKSGETNRNKANVGPDIISSGESSAGNTSKKAVVVPDITSSSAPTRKRTGSAMRVGKKLKLGNVLSSFGM